MEQRDQIMGLASTFLILHFIGSYAWTNLFLAVQIPEQQIEITGAQAQLIAIQMPIISLTMTLAFVLYILLFVGLYALPLLTDLLDRYHIVIEETNAGNDDPRAPPAQP
jgi:hypothetical protein